MVQDTATMANRKSHMVYRMVPFSMTLMTPNPDFKVWPFFHVTYLQNG